MRWLLVVALLGCDARRGRLEIVAAPTGAVAAVVRDAAARARGRTLLVYEGASWCAPCKAFHDAAAAGALDAALPGVTLVEFDADVDNDRLADAGYLSDLLPLFAKPAADGRASGRMIQGGISGPRSVEELVPRLQELVTP